MVTGSLGTIYSYPLLVELLLVLPAAKNSRSVASLVQERAVSLFAAECRTPSHCLLHFWLLSFGNWVRSGLDWLRRQQW